MSTLRVGIPARVSLVPVLIVLVLAASACNGGEVTAPGGSSSVAPMSALPPASAAVDSSPAGRLSSRPLGQTTYALSNGSFTVTGSNGDSFGGVYTGRAAVSSSGRTTAALDLDVTSGTGAFSGAQGSLNGDGSGAFGGEGAFSLSLDGFISTAADNKFHLKAVVSGKSGASCGSQGLLLTLQGDGVAAKLGNVQTVLTHLVGNAGCGN